MLTELTIQFSGSGFVLMTCFVILTGYQSVDVVNGSVTASTISREHAEQNERAGSSTTKQISPEQKALLNLPSISASIKRIEASRSATTSIALGIA